MTTPLYRTLTSHDPHGELKPCFTISSQNISEFIDARRGTRGSFLLQESQRLPPVTSILPQNMSAAPTQQPWVNWYGVISEQSTPWAPHHTPMSWTQPLPATDASHQCETAKSQPSLQNPLRLLRNVHQRAGSDPHSYFGDGCWEKTGTGPRPVCIPLPKLDWTAYELEWSRVINLSTI